MMEMMMDLVAAKMLVEIIIKSVFILKSQADLNYGLTGGTATWTGIGQSIWTGADSNPICIDFYDPDNTKPTCCCNLATPTLGYETEITSELTGCECKL